MSKIANQSADQYAAMGRGLKACQTESVIYDAPELDEWALSATGGGLYRKELIYAGEFVKSGGAEEMRLAVDSALMSHWVETHDRMTANGNEVPLPVQHTEDPEKRRGTVETLRLEKDSQGRDGLFAYVRFRDAEAEKLTASGVSIYVPPMWKDGKGVTYSRPIRHVALTDYPVIPGLDKFQAIVASITEGDSGMPLKALAKALGVTIKDGDADDVMEKAIVASVKALRAEITSLKAKKPEDKKPATIAASFITLVRDNREMKLAALVAAGNITPAVKDKLTAQYCSDGALTLSLSNDGTASDGFDAMVAALKENEPLALSEQTGAQGVRLSHGTDKDPKVNPLMAAVERQVEAAK